MGHLNDLGVKHQTDKITEYWLPVVGYENLYQVSSLGNVKALCVSKLRGRFVHNQPERLLRLKTHRDGYLISTLCKDGGNKMFQVHRLVAMSFIDNTDNKPFVNHKNGIKHDNSKGNLEWCTAKENAIHSVKIGHTLPTNGEINGMAKLKEHQVKKIFLSSKSERELSYKYNISRSHINRIRIGKSWIHITSKLNKIT